MGLSIWSADLGCCAPRWKVSPRSPWSGRVSIREVCFSSGGVATLCLVLLLSVPATGTGAGQASLGMESWPFAT